MSCVLYKNLVQVYCKKKKCWVSHLKLKVKKKSDKFENNAR